jgi:endoglucanase
MKMRRLSPVSLALSLFLLAGCDDGTTVYGKPVERTQIHTSSVGYLPDRAKKASFSGDNAAFRVVREDDSVAFEGVASEPINATDSGELVRVADFTALEEHGRFRVVVEGVGKSPFFEISPDVFVSPLKVTMSGLYGQRCGVAVEVHAGDDVFRHGECHHGDTAVAPVSGGDPQDASKGWHDAGDYGKYVNNGAFSLGMMLQAFELWPEKLAALELDIPERGGKMPDYLDECAFQLAWLFGMQLPDGSVSDRITTQTFDAMIAPEASNAPRRLSPASSVATADFVAVMALAARVYEPYDEDLAARALDAALRAQAFLDEHPMTIPFDTNGYTGGYTSADVDDRFWAHAELWVTTGEPKYLEAFEARAPQFHVRNNFDWPDLGNMGIFSYILAEREGKSEAIVEQYMNEIVKSADALAQGAETHAYGRSLGGMYYWGINGVIARTTMNLRVAERLTGDVKYLDAAVAQLDHLFGRNYYGRSQVTGLGAAPPVQPHHRPSVANGRPWPGLLVGGPNASVNNATPATTWNDSFSDYETNEVAINWNAALAYALAGFLP